MQFVGIYPKELKLESQRDIYAPMFIVAVVIMAKIWKQSECLSRDESRKCTICYMYTGVLFSVKKKKKKMLLFVSTWVTPDDFMLCEMSQSQKNTACVYLHKI